MVFETSNTNRPIDDDGRRCPNDCGGVPEMKVAIYARVSTEDQTDLNQKMILEQWAKDKGWEIIAIYEETGSAWQKHADQKELRRLIEDCRVGKFNTVIVYDLSRLSRQGPVETLLIIRRLAAVGGEIRSYRESWIEQFTSPMFREAMIALIGWLNEDSSRTKSERTKAGMARAKAQGIHVGRPRKKVTEKSPVPFSIQKGEKAGV